MQTVKRAILITGASSGIGRATAEMLLQQGHRVIGSSRALSRLTTEHVNFFPLQLDLDDLQHLPDQIAALQLEHPQIDAAVFCAGYGRFGSLEEFSYPQIQALLNVNLSSQIIMTRALINGFKRKQRSDLIFIGSEAALKGSRKGAVYCAGKFALRGFAQALREECARCGLRVSLINPGMVKTAFFDKLAFAPGDACENYLLPEDVAAAICYVLHASKTAVIDEINLNPLNKVVQFKKTS